MESFWSALIGAVVGGALSFAGAWWQTRNLLEHERKMARDARDEAAVTLRREEQRRAASALVGEVANLLVWQAHEIGGGMTNDRWARFDQTVLAMRVLAGGTAPLAAAAPRARWNNLVDLAEEFRRRPVVRDESEMSPGSWTRKTKIRAANDLLRYGRYTRDTLIASIDGAEVPEEIPPPELNRSETMVWNWDPSNKDRGW
jgi:hypothetical protein